MNPSPSTLGIIGGLILALGILVIWRGAHAADRPNFRDLIYKGSEICGNDPCMRYQTLGGQEYFYLPGLGEWRFNGKIVQVEI